MNDQKTLILEAGDSFAAIEAAKAGIEAAKARLEEAKAGVESARLVLDGAKAEYDAVLDRCEAAGLVKSKVRKAAEMIGTAFAEAGIGGSESAVEPAKAQESATAPAPRRKRRSKQEEEAGQQDSRQEAGAHESPSEAGQQVGAPSDFNAEDSASEAPIDFSEEVAEVRSVIDELVPAGQGEREDAARGLLLSLLDALAWRAARGAEGSIDLESYRDMLAPAAVAVIARTPGLDVTTVSVLDAALLSEDCDRILAWAHRALTLLEHSHDGIVAAGPLFDEAPEHHAGEQAHDPVTEPDEAPAELRDLHEPEAVAISIGEETVDAPAAAEPSFEEEGVADDMDELEHGYGGSAPADDYDDFAPSDSYDHVDDDASFPMGGDEELHEAGEVLGDIGEINFLDGEASDAGVPAASAPEPVPAAPAPAAPAPKPEAPKVPRGNFATPAFLKKS